MADTLTPEMREGLPEPEGYRVNSIPDENDIVFGKGPITEETARNMILDYPDSVLKFLQGKDLDERPLSPDISGIHGIWRERGLRKDIGSIAYPMRTISSLARVRSPKRLRAI